MLSDPKCLKTPGGFGYLVSWKHRLRVESETQARELAKRLLADPYNVEQIRSALGRPEATPEELEEWLATGLAAKAMVALKTKPRPPVFDAPTVTNLTDLLPPERPDSPPQVGSWIGFQAVDSKGRPLPFLKIDTTDHGATDVSIRGDAEARARLDDLPSEEAHTVTVRWSGEPHPGGAASVTPPGVHEPCWVKLDLVDRKGRPLRHLQPEVAGVRAASKRGAAFLAAGLDEAQFCSVVVLSVEGEA